LFVLSKNDQYYSHISNFYNSSALDNTYYIN
jgi:hypothetical protein